MTINGPAPMLLAFFMNAAIDQQCEKYIIENNLQAEIEEKINAIYEGKHATRPKYSGELPEGNNGLGLMLLGLPATRYYLQMYMQKSRHKPSARCAEQYRQIF